LVEEDKRNQIGNRFELSKSVNTIIFSSQTYRGKPCFLSSTSFVWFGTSLTWYEKHSNFLVDKCFSKGSIDAIFTKTKNDNFLLMQIYVDDIIFDSTHCVKCLLILRCTNFGMSFVGGLTFLLGCKSNIQWNLQQSRKICKEIRKKFVMEGAKSIVTLQARVPS